MPTKLNKEMLQRIQRLRAEFSALDPDDQAYHDPYARAYGGEVLYLARKLQVSPLRAKTLMRMSGIGDESHNGGKGLS